MFFPPFDTLLKLDSTPSALYALIISFNHYNSPRRQVPLLSTLDFNSALCTSPRQRPLPTKHACSMPALLWLRAIVHSEGVCGLHTRQAGNAGKECPRKKPWGHGRWRSGGELSQHPWPSPRTALKCVYYTGSQGAPAASSSRQPPG